MFIAICSCIDADWLYFGLENDKLSSAVARANKVRGTKIDEILHIKTDLVPMQIMRDFKIL